MGAVALQIQYRMVQRILWTILIYLACTCHGESSVGPEDSQIKKVYFSEGSKQRLTDSVIWFKPKEATGEGESYDEDVDVTKINTIKTISFIRQNKSVNEDMNTDENIANNKGNTLHENIEKSSADENISEKEQSIKKRRKNNEENRKRNKSRIRNENDQLNTKETTKTIDNNETTILSPQIKNAVQNIEENLKPIQLAPSMKETPRSPASKNIAQEVKIKATNEIETKKEEQIIKSKLAEEKQKDNATKITEGKETMKVATKETSRTAEIRNNAKEVKAKAIDQLKAKVEEQIKASNMEDERKKDTKVKNNEENRKRNESSTLSSSDKEMIVENADLLQLLLAKSDPGLVQVLLDNSSPENLNVFLNNSNITLEELKDIVAY